MQAFELSNKRVSATGSIDIKTFDRNEGYQNSLRDATDLIELEIVAKVSAGVPIEAIQQRSQTVRIPRGLFKQKPTYLLRVKGDSMQDAGILDGDLVAIRKADSAQAGDFVVARMGNDVTLKELQVRNQRPVLVPHNKKYAEITVVPEEFRVEGVFVGILRGRALH